MRVLITLFVLCTSVAFAQNDGEKLFRKVDKSVVAIQHERAGGSGFIVDESGLIVTNGHVVSMMDVENPRDTARRITVILHNDKKYQARVIGFSLDPDVALLKIETTEPLDAVEIGNSDKVVTGQTCYAFGAPLGQKRTLTGGIISNTARTSLGTFTKVFQMDAIINPGNSGGPLFNAKGEVIGVNTYGGKAGMGFSIPIKYAMTLKEHFQKFGRFVRTDVPFFVSKAMPEEFAKVLGTPQGVYVDYIIPNSYSESIGLKNGDVIIEMDGKPSSGKSEEDYYEWNWDLQTKVVGEKIVFKILRKENGKWVEKTVSGILKEDEPAPQYGRQIGELKEISYPELGWGVQSITMGSYFIYNLPTDKGMRVSSVKSNGAVARAGINANDVIVKINDQEITDEETFQNVVDGILTEQKKFMSISTLRGNDKYFNVVKVSYYLKNRKVLIISNGAPEELAIFKRRLQLQGAKVTVSSTVESYADGDWDGVLLHGELAFSKKENAELLASLVEKKTVLGLIGKTPLLLVDGPESLKDSKITMDKDFSPKLIKLGFNYTGKDVESDGTLVTSTGFDRKTSRSFLEAFSASVARRTDPRD
ncbi:MAG: trypsin-like peptidase domain-containing protein [Lentisphaeraceae bacterium]|nr:trypsin-like peptidase domain-containing protein [Lentisphaeraceae bacterium]